MDDAEMKMFMQRWNDLVKGMEEIRKDDEKKEAAKKRLKNAKAALMDAEAKWKDINDSDKKVQTIAWNAKAKATKEMKECEANVKRLYK